MNTTTKAKTTTSIPTHEWETNYDGEHAAEPVETLAVGDRGYLVETHDENRNASRWTLQNAPAVTNRSYEPRAEGWLGTTNNIARYGRGFVEVVHIGPRTIRVRKVPLVEQDGQDMSPDEQLAELATTWRESQTTEAAARDALAAAARTAHANGMSAYRIGKVTGAAPDTIRKWLKES